MKVTIPSNSDKNIGGGHSFKRNLEKGLIKEGVEIVDNWKDADIILIAGATLLKRDNYNLMKQEKKKIILRADNILRNSRNRATGMSRMKEYANGVDTIVYQTKWCRSLLEPFLGKSGEVIMNSIDETIFKPKGAYKDYSKKGNPIYLYSRYNRDEIKQWIVAYYEFIKISQKNPDAFLVLIGRFSDDLRQYNFDFYYGEKYDYSGIMPTAKDMAQVYRGVDKMIIPYTYDACSNTLLEMLLTKNIKDYNDILVAYNRTGGNGEILDKWKEYGRDYFSLKRMANEYLTLFESLL